MLYLLLHFYGHELKEQPLIYMNDKKKLWKQPEATFFSNTKNLVSFILYECKLIAVRK